MSCLFLIAVTLNSVHNILYESGFQMMVWGPWGICVAVYTVTQEEKWKRSEPPEG